MTTVLKPTGASQLRYARHYQGWTLEQMAAVLAEASPTDIKIDRHDVWAMEREQTPTPEWVRRLAVQWS